MSPYQYFSEAEADLLHAEGCQCSGDSGSCAWCAVYYDPTPYCAGCNAKTRAKCDCGPRAEND